MLSSLSPINTTHRFLALQNARLIPPDQAGWFAQNKMAQYCVNEWMEINDVANGVALRSDVHGCFDRGSFVFCPLDAGHHISYVIGWEEDYAARLHRRKVTMHARIPGEFLYVRFALSIFRWLSPAWKYPATPSISCLVVEKNEDDNSGAGVSLSL